MTRFLRIHDHTLINAALIERVEFAIIDGEDHARAILSNGTSVVLEGTFTEARTRLLPVVAAAPGSMAISAGRFDAQKNRQPIVAWVVNGDCADPVTAGDIDALDSPGVLFPDGRVFDPRDNKTYLSETEWRVAREGRIPRSAIEAVTKLKA